MDINQMPADKKKYIIGGVVLVVVLVVAGILVSQRGGLTGQKASPAGSKINPNALPTVEGGTREAVTRNIATPEANATSAPKDVAVPFNAIQTGAIGFRQFNIQGSGGKYIPSTLVVNEGDVIDLKLEAVDGDYNLFFPDFGVSVSAVSGQSAKAQFQASNYGQYQFYCKDVCKGSVTGTLIVNKK